MLSSWGVCQGAGSLSRKGDGVLAFGEVTLIARVATSVGTVVDRDFSTSSLSDSLVFFFLVFQFATFNSKQFLYVDLWFRLLKNTKKLCFLT